MVVYALLDGDNRPIYVGKTVNLQNRSAAWQKTGWKTYDPASKPYGADEVRKERQTYTGGI